MVFVKVLVFSIATAAFIVSGCGNTMDDLKPSAADKRPAVQSGTTGPGVGQNAPDFSLSDTLNTPFTLSSRLTTVKGAVLYFTMWCPVCDDHMSNMRDSTIPRYPDVLFFAVDYVSGSVSLARNSQLENGFDGSGFTVLADTTQTALHLYQATMGTTVVIGRDGVIRMNEDYKDGTKLQNILGGLP